MTDTVEAAFIGVGLFLALLVGIAARSVGVVLFVLGVMVFLRWRPPR